MRTTSAPQRLMASSLGLLLVSCSATRYSAPTSTDAYDLSRSVLVIKEAPDGQVVHSWEPMSNFDLSRVPYPADDSGVQGKIVRASWTRDCDEELDTCMDMCRQSLRGRNWSHASRGSKEEMCRKRCNPAYLDCCQLREQAEAMKFTAVDEAVDWLKRNRQEVLLGTVIIIAGVAFVVVVVGTGGAALVLAPAVLLASSDVSSARSIAAAKP
jgi:hypothetical protein